MNKRLLLVGSLSLVIIAFAFLLFGGNKRAEPTPLPSISATPTLHPDSGLIRRLATEFVPKWGTYSYKDFDAYESRVKSLLTKQYGEQAFGAEQRPFRIRSLERSRFRIRTRLTKVDSVSFNNETFTVKALANETISDFDGTRKTDVRYQITYVRTGSLWKVNNVLIEK